MLAGSARDHRNCAARALLLAMLKRLANSRTGALRSKGVCARRQYKRTRLGRSNLCPPSFRAEAANHTQGTSGHRFTKDRAQSRARPLRLRIDRPGTTLDGSDVAPLHSPRQETTVVRW